MNDAPAEFTKDQSVVALAKRFALTRMVCFNISISWLLSYRFPIFNCWPRKLILTEAKPEILWRRIFLMVYHEITSFKWIIVMRYTAKRKREWRIPEPQTRQTREPLKLRPGSVRVHIPIKIIFKQVKLEVISKPSPYEN